LPLVPISLALYPLHLVGKIYFAIALGMGSIFLGFVLAGLWAKDELKWGEKVFRVSLLYLTILFIFMFVDGVRA
jgi:heme O synthase-like polyprenyltransferase